MTTPSDEARRVAAARETFDDKITAFEALKVLAYHPTAPWNNGRWDVYHKPTRPSFTQRFRAPSSRSKTMPDRETLLALAGRCEQATGPDRALGREILLVVTGGYVSPMGANMDPTTSIDAALTLVPEGADSGGIRCTVEMWNDQSCYAPHVKATAWVAGAVRTYAATPALALCAASLRARATEGEG